MPYLLAVLLLLAGNRNYRLYTAENKYFLHLDNKAVLLGVKLVQLAIPFMLYSWQTIANSNEWMVTKSCPTQVELKPLPVNISVQY